VNAAFGIKYHSGRKSPGGQSGTLISHPPADHATRACPILGAPAQTRRGAKRISPTGTTRDISLLKAFAVSGTDVKSGSLTILLNRANVEVGRSYLPLRQIF
jgi:hypothetical protein